MVRLTEIDIVSLALSIYLFSSLKIVLITLLLGQKFNFKHIIISTGCKWHVNFERAVRRNQRCPNDLWREIWDWIILCHGEGIKNHLSWANAKKKPEHRQWNNIHHLTIPSASCWNFVYSTEIRDSFWPPLKLTLTFYKKNNIFLFWWWCCCCSGKKLTNSRICPKSSKNMYIY